MKITKDMLERFGRNECSREEMQAIRQWLKEDSWPWYAAGEEVPEEMKETLWKKLQEHIRVTPLSAGRRSRKIPAGILMAAAACAVLVLTTVLLNRQPVSPASQQAVVFSTSSTAHKKIILADSSVVFLSPGSSLRVMQPFGKDNREVTLTGEAIFEATHDPRHPFSVISGDLVTTALGTSFKVTSFPGKDETKVALSYGKVVVKDRVTPEHNDSLYLDPGEEAVYDKTTQTIHKSEKANRQFDYKNNILYFKDAGITEVVRKLSEYYQMEVRYDSLQGVNWSVSGEFDYQPLATVLQAIAYSCNIRYEINNHQLVLKPNS